MRNESNGYFGPMFNLLVKFSGWGEGRDKLGSDRVFEYTESDVEDKFVTNDHIDFNSLRSLPTLFLEETRFDSTQTAQVGTIINARKTGREISLEYAFDQSVPPITNQKLGEIRTELDIAEFEFSRTHWAIKDVDLFRVLIRHTQPRRHRPHLFTLADPENIDRTLISAMMPFHPHFDAVYEKLQDVENSVGLTCKRADDIWENPTIIQDVVSLIDRSRTIICDCTDRNPNVFYEAGIAHTLGREVILITQSDADIPFDLRHIRYVRYLNNSERLEALAQQLQPRLIAIANA